MSGGPTVVPSGAVVVYTAITGGYDSLKPQPQEARKGADFVAFLGAPRSSGTWQTRMIHEGFPDPALNAKIHKILPHRSFPQARYSLWIDGSVTILFSHSIERLIDRYLADCDLAVFRHSSRICLYQEADVCLRRGLDDPALILRQVSRYTHEGYPPNAGLAECTVVLRRHTPAVEAFNEAWWDEIVRNSRRDQLSFPYVAAKMGLRYGTFPGTVKDNPLFRRVRHTTPFRLLFSRLVNRKLVPKIAGLSARARAALISLRRRSAWRRPSVQGHAGMRVKGVDAGAPRPTATALPGRVPVTRGTVRRRVVGIGPVRDYPSWGWVGFDTARELSRDFDVVFYDVWTDPPACDVLLAIKERPPAGFIDAIRTRGSKLVYCPVDALRDRDPLTREAEIFRACDMVLVHSERLLPLVTPYCANTHFVEHHGRFVTPAPAAFKESGYVLWVGGYQYVPYLLRWLDRHPFQHELRVLTDIDNYRARSAARILAAEIGVKLPRLGDGRYATGFSMLPWSERRQEAMMRECRAAMDVKATDSFNQCCKPPTKAQQMIASGIPFAVNPESYSAEYFRQRGFELASPSDPARWLSREYWEITQRHGKDLRAAISLEAVATQYRVLIDAL
jgi:hypothetical protein